MIDDDEISPFCSLLNAIEGRGEREENKHIDIEGDDMIPESYRELIDAGLITYMDYIALSTTVINNCYNNNNNNNNNKEEEEIKLKGEEETLEKKTRTCLPEQDDIYKMNDDAFCYYISKLESNRLFIAQDIYVYPGMSMVIVNHVLTYYLHKDYPQQGMYDLSLPLIHKQLLPKGVTCDSQNSKLVKRYNPPLRYSLLIFKSGILVGTGPPNENTANLLTMDFVRDLRNHCGYRDIVIGESRCQNLVAAGEFHRKLCLHVMAKRYPFVTYPNRKFAGAVVHLPGKRFKSIAMLVFMTRKIICVGSKSKEILIKAFRALLKIMEACTDTDENLELEKEIKEDELKKNKKKETQHIK